MYSSWGWVFCPSATSKIQTISADLLSIRHHNPDHSRVVVYEELRLKHELHGVHHVLLSLEVGV